jgi:hypothetical protein
MNGMLFVLFKAVMVTGKKIIKLMAFVSGVTAIASIIRRHHMEMQRDKRVAEEGYETAYDILFPEEKDDRKKMQYGPVIPGQLAV